jgi:hypothetical protein
MSCCGEFRAPIPAPKGSFSLLDAARAAVRGEFAADDVVKQREEICYGCERHFAMTDTCFECSCFMPLKRMFSGARCDLGKW